MNDTLLADRFESLVSGAASPETGDLTSEENADLQLLLRLARAIPPATAVVPGPDPDFVTSLGVRLREEAHRLDLDQGASAHAPARRLRLLPGGGRALRWAGGLVAATVLALGVLGVASRQALPGDLLYPVKQLLDRIAVQVSGSHYDTGMTWLAQAEQHIGEARRLIDEGAPPAPDVSSAYDSASTAVRNAERELALDWRQSHSDRSRLALPDFAATALPLLDAARPDVPAGSLPAWQGLRDLLAPYAAMRQTGSTTPPGVDPTASGPTPGATTTAPPVGPSGPGSPTVGLSASATATGPVVLPTSSTPRPTATDPLPSATVPLPTVTAPRPTATVPLPTATVPLPTVTIPLPTVTLPSVTITLPTITVPLPTVTIPLPTVSKPLPTLTLPRLAPGSG